jgi:formiminotetrahydrofolate cyclodeaminase
VAALAGALAAALAAMVGRLTVGKRKYADVNDEMRDLIVEAEKLRATLTATIEEDIAAFNAVMAAYKLPKGTDEEQVERAAAIQRAMTRAAEVPLATAQHALAAMELALVVASKGNTNAITDAATAAWMAMAALQGAALNVRINATSIEDAALSQSWLKTLGTLTTRAESVLAQVQEAAVQRGGL